VINELWLDKLNDSALTEDTIAKYLENLRKYLLNPGDFSKRKDEICTVHQGKHSKQFTLGQMLVSGYFLRILENAGIKIQLTYFFESRESTDLNAYIDNISRIYEEKNSDIGTLKQGVADSITKLTDDMARIVYIHGSTVNLYELGRMAKEHKEFDDLLHFEIPEGLYFNEIEVLVNSKIDAAMKFLSETPSVYRELIRGNAVSTRQLGQSIITIGLKPDLEGAIIPEPINTSFIRGLRNRQDLYSCAIGARKALIISHNQVKQSGYLTKQLSLLCLDSVLSNEEYCDTKYTMPIEVKSKDTFKRLIGRVMENGHVIEPSDEAELVGKQIDIYSPITCNCKTGICKRCYGKLSNIVEGYHVGMVAVLLLTNPLTQRLLSAKHLLSARTPKIDWGEDFDAVFKVDKDCIMPCLETSKISFEVNDIIEDDEGDLYVKHIHVVNRGRSLEIISPKKLFLMEPQIKKYAHESQTIKFEPEQNEPCFKIKTKNIELNAALNSLTELISKSDHDGFGNDICGIFGSFIDKLDETKINLMSVHAEVILSNLVFDASTETRPEFSDPDHEIDLEVKSVSQAIIQKPNLSTALSFEQLKKQLNNPKTYKKRKVGVFDRLFV